jgi:hypothetical protein
MHATLSEILVLVGGTAGVGKFFLMLADSMPPPPENCGYFFRWFYDFIQKVASNGLKVGATRTATQPPAVTLASAPLSAPDPVKP